MIATLSSSHPTGTFFLPLDRRPVPPSCHSHSTGAFRRSCTARPLPRESPGRSPVRFAHRSNPRAVRRRTGPRWPREAEVSVRGTAGPCSTAGGPVNRPASTNICLFVFTESDSYRFAPKCRHTALPKNEPITLTPRDGSVDRPVRRVLWTRCRCIGHATLFWPCLDFHAATGASDRAEEVLSAAAALVSGPTNSAQHLKLSRAPVRSAKLPQTVVKIAVTPA